MRTQARAHSSAGSQREYSRLICAFRLRLATAVGTGLAVGLVVCVAARRWLCERQICCMSCTDCGRHYTLAFLEAFGRTFANGV